MQPMEELALVLLAHCSFDIFDIFPRTLLVFTSLVPKPESKGNEAKSEVCFCKDGSAYRVALPAGKDLRAPPAIGVPRPCVNTLALHC